jgi:hypothetical protein
VRRGGWSSARAAGWRTSIDSTRRNRKGVVVVWSRGRKRDITFWLGSFLTGGSMIARCPWVLLLLLLRLQAVHSLKVRRGSKAMQPGGLCSGCGR